ncbi:MAG: hypothetical protein ACKVQT_01800 [Burkholderiales bacterium]
MPIVKGIEISSTVRSEVIREAMQAQPNAPRPYDKQDWALTEKKTC